MIGSSTSLLMARSSSRRGFRMWMPNMPMSLISAQDATETSPAKASFRVLPRMTKHEVKEYLTKIYNLPITKVNTMNYLGKRKKVQARRITAYYKYADWKKAIVTFDKTLLREVEGLASAAKVKPEENKDK